MCPGPEEQRSKRTAFDNSLSNLQKRRAFTKRFVEKYGLDLVTVCTVRKNEAKASKKIPLFKEKKTDILRNQNLTTEDYVKKIDTGIYDDGFAIICGLIRRGKYAGYKFIFVDIDLKEGVRAFLDTGAVKTTLEELADKQYVEFNSVDRAVFTNSWVKRAK